MTQEGKFESDNQILEPVQNESLTLLLKIGALCNDSRLEEDGQWSIKGDPTEGALVVAAAKANLNKEAIEAKFQRIDEIPFDPKERYMVTFHKENEDSIQVFAKGAPEAILALCNQVSEDGAVKELTQQKKESTSRNQHGSGKSSLKNIRHGIPNNQKQGP